MADDRPAPLTELSFENARPELINRANAIRAGLGLDPVVDDHVANPFVIFFDTLALYIELKGSTIDNRVLSAMLITARNLTDGTIGSDNIGYNWKGVAPAVVDINLDFGAGWGENIELLEGHKFLAAPNYILSEDTTILAGTPSISLPLRQATREQNTVISNGGQGQVFTMPQTPVVKGSASVAVDAVPYRVVRDLFELRIGEEGLEFRVNENEQGKQTTGDGTNGKVIPLGGSIVTDYETSIGEDGRIGSGTIVDTVDPILDILTNPVTVIITQPFGSSGGSNRESLESMQFNGPRSLRTLEASIGRSDFVTNAEEVAGVLRALVLTNIQDGSIAANTTLILIAAEAPGVGETTLFSDDHNDGVIPAGTWLQISGSWSEAAGEMTASGPTDIIRIDNFSSHFPAEFRANLRVLDTSEARLVMFKASNLTDYLFVRLTSDGAGNTTFGLGQVLAAATTETTSVEAIDTQVLTDIVFRFNLTEGLVLEVGGSPILTFTPDISFREQVVAEYRGYLSINQTDFVILTDNPVPGQALLDDVEDHIATSRPTLVSHRVITGQLEFAPLNLIIDMTPLVGFTVTQSRANIIAEIVEYLSLTRRNEDKEFANLPGVTISLDEIYSVIRQADGVDRAQIIWPTVWDIVPGPREMIIPGEIKWS